MIGDDDGKHHNNTHTEFDDATTGGAAAALAPNVVAVHNDDGINHIPHVVPLRFRLTETKGDLFSCDAAESLVHCVSQDLRMGMGIAVAFKTKFGGVPELMAQNKLVGDVAILHRPPRYIYYMVLFFITALATCSLIIFYFYFLFFFICTDNKIQVLA